MQQASSLYKGRLVAEDGAVDCIALLRLSAHACCEAASQSLVRPTADSSRKSLSPLSRSPRRVSRLGARTTVVPEVCRRYQKSYRISPHVAAFDCLLPTPAYRLPAARLRSLVVPVLLPAFLSSIHGEYSLFAPGVAGTTVFAGIFVEAWSRVRSSAALVKITRRRYATTALLFVTITITPATDVYKHGDQEAKRGVTYRLPLGMLWKAAGSDTTSVLVERRRAHCVIFYGGCVTRLRPFLTHLLCL